MAKKAVYNNLHLAIYITQEDFDEMLKWGYTKVQVQIGKNDAPMGSLKVELTPLSRSSLFYAQTAERRAIQEVQDQFAKDHPDYESSSTIQTRSKRAKRRLRRRTNDVD